MAVTAVWRKVDGREGSLDSKGVRRYTQRFGVKCSSVTDEAGIVLLATGVPKIFDVYTNGTVLDTGAFCREVKPTQSADDPTVWEVVAEYSNEPGRPDQIDENPLLRAPKIRWGSQVQQRALTTDIYGLPVCSSAFEPFDPPPSQDRYLLTLSITRNEAAYDPAVAALYLNAVNLDAFFGFGAGAVVCTKMDGDFDYSSAVPFWSVSYEFLIDLEGHTLRLLDQGYYAYDTSSPAKRYLIKDEKLQQPLSSPAPLDGLGHALTKATAPGAPPREGRWYVNPNWPGSTSALATGVYLARYTYQYSAGESGVSTEVVFRYDTAGAAPIVEFPPMPAGALSRNLYLSSPNGTPDTLLKQVTGITTGTYEITAAYTTGGIHTAPPVYGDPVYRGFETHPPRLFAALNLP